MLEKLRDTNVSEEKKETGGIEGCQPEIKWIGRRNAYFSWRIKRHPKGNAAGRGKVGKSERQCEREAN